MNNVIQFPPRRDTQADAAAPVSTGSKTLFVHVKSTTMIVHLAAQRNVPPAGGRVGSS